MTVPAPTRLLNPALALYLAGLSGTALADAILTVALPFVVLAAGGTAAGLGLVALCASLPRFAALLLGALADRLPLRPLVVTAAVLRTLLVLGVGGYALSGGSQVGVFAVFALLNGTLVALTLTSGYVVVPRLVAEAQRPQGNSLVSGTSQGVQLLGYGLGGLLVHWIGGGPTLLLAAPLYLLLALVAALLSAYQESPTAARHLPLLRDLADGWQLVRRQRLLLFNLGLTFLLNLTLNVLNVRGPLFAQTVGRGALDYAWLEGLFSGGVLLGILAVWLLRRSTVRVQFLVALVVSTLGLLGHGVAQLPAWFAASAVTGLGIGLLDVTSMTQLQQLVPDGLRGRVTGLSMSLAACGLSLGALVGGARWATPSLMVGLGVVLALYAAGYVPVSRPQRVAVRERG